MSEELKPYTNSDLLDIATQGGKLSPLRILATYADRKNWGKDNHGPNGRNQWVWIGPVICAFELAEWGIEYCPEPRQDWDEEALWHFIVNFMANNNWNGEKKFIDGVDCERLAKSLIQHFKPPAKVKIRWPNVEYMIEKFDKFIEKWTGNAYPHLIDSDENDGEQFRDLLRDCFRSYCNTKIVWPEKNDETDFPTLEEDSPELNKMIGWNACLAEFKRLNPDLGEGKT